MDTGFRGGIAHDTDRFTRAFAGAGIGLGALSPNRQAAQVSHPAIAFDALQAFQVHADLAAQVAFDDVFAILDRMDDLGELLLGQIFGTNPGVDIRLGQDVFRIGGPNAVDIAQGNIDALIGRDFDADDTS